MENTKEKLGFFGRISKFFREFKSEVKKITWPTFSQVVHNTGVVITAIIIVGAIIWVLDQLFRLGIGFIL